MLFFQANKMKTIATGAGAYLCYRLVSGAPAFVMGDAILPSCDAKSVNNRMGELFLSNIIGASTSGSIASAIFMDEINMDAHVFRPYSFAQKWLPALPALMGVAANVIGDLATSAFGMHCKAYKPGLYATYADVCVDHDAFLSCDGLSNIVGDAILTTGVMMVGYAGYKLFHRYHDAPVAVQGEGQPVQDISIVIEDEAQVEREPGEAVDVSYHQLEGEPSPAEQRREGHVLNSQRRYGGFFEPSINHVGEQQERYPVALSLVAR